GDPLPSSLGIGNMSRDNAAGLQLALWQIEYGDINNITTPAPVVGNLANVMAAYTAFLNDATGKSELATYINGLPESITNPGRPDGSQGLMATGSLNFANAPTSSIGDYVWADQNMNGLQDASEPGIAGAMVSLTDDSGNPVHDASGVFVASQTTGPDGHYLF